VGTLCVRAFEDVAGDTRYNQGDGALASGVSAAFIVADASGRTIAAKSPTPSEERGSGASTAAHCFEDLLIGAYTVSAQTPPGYAATTGTRWDVSLTEGARVEVTAGMKRADPSVDGMASAATPIAAPAGAAAGLACLAVIIMLIRRRATSSRATWDA